MINLKISNLAGLNGRCDYKGLDIDLIVPGTQVYPSGEDVAYFSFDGDLVEHPDITVLTEEEYQAAISAEQSKPQPKSELETLREQVALMQSALDELLLGGAL